MHNIGEVTIFCGLLNYVLLTPVSNQKSHNDYEI